VRFGIQQSGKTYTAAEYGPAHNVRKGALPDTKKPNDCPTNNKIGYSSQPLVDMVMGLPHDDCFDTSTCTLMGGRMGGGTWDLTDYWSINHGGASVPTDLWPVGGEEPTRYEVYLYEIANGLVADLSSGGESGSPQSGCVAPVTTVDRRLLYGALLNCKALSETFNLGGKDEDLPVAAFASFFLTEPIKNDTDIYAELVDVTGHYGQGSLEKFQRDEAQLYR
jgi:hypothetical protein